MSRIVGQWGEGAAVTPAGSDPPARIGVVIAEDGIVNWHRTSYPPLENAGKHWRHRRPWFHRLRAWLRGRRTVGVEQNEQPASAWAEELHEWVEHPNGMAEFDEPFVLWVEDPLDSRAPAVVLDGATPLFDVVLDDWILRGRELEAAT